MATRRTTTCSAHGPDPWEPAGVPDDWATFGS